MNLLEVNNLGVQFQTRDRVVHAVNGISFEVHEGEIFGLVGALIEVVTDAVTVAIADARLVDEAEEGAGAWAAAATAWP